MFSHIYIIKKHQWSLALPWSNNDWRRFSSQPEMVLSILIHRLFLDIRFFMMFISLILNSFYRFSPHFVFDFSILQASQFYGYLVHSLSTWFIQSLNSPVSRLSATPAHPTCGGLRSTLSVQEVIFLVIPWTTLYDNII